jgi:hypothetical protein
MREDVEGVEGLPYFQVFFNARRARKKSVKHPKPSTPSTDYAQIAYRYMVEEAKVLCIEAKITLCLQAQPR